MRLERIASRAAADGACCRTIESKVSLGSSLRALSRARRMALAGPGRRAFRETVRGSRVTVKPESIQQARRRINGHHVYGAPPRGTAHRERGADGRLAHSARSQACDEAIPLEIQRARFHYATRPA